MRLASVFCGLVAMAALASCTSRSGTVKPPDIDPAAAAQAAMAQYDTNGDSALAAGEIETSALSLEKWDADGNGSISQREIEQRLTRYVEHGTGMSGLSCYVRLNNRPLSGAMVTFKPEAFLGGAIHPASGTTGSDGTAAIAVAEKFRLRPELETLQVGLYTVEISHPEVTIRDVSPSAFELVPWEDLETPTFLVRQ